MRGMAIQMRIFTRMTVMAKPKRPWWKFWARPPQEAPRAIAYDRNAVQRGTVDPIRKSAD